jgi:hypothetical protein
VVQQLTCTQQHSTAQHTNYLFLSYTTCDHAPAPLCRSCTAPSYFPLRQHDCSPLHPTHETRETRQAAPQQTPPIHPTCRVSAAEPPLDQFLPQLPILLQPSNPPHKP